MATAQHAGVEQIGETAGTVWHLLNDKGPLSLTKLTKDVDAPRDVVLQAVGWLAREGKIEVDDSKSKVVSLRD
jgi:hypothetical protein